MPGLGPSRKRRPWESTIVRVEMRIAWRAFCSTRRIAVPGRVDGLDDSENLRHEDRRQSHARLVEEDEAGAGHERPPDGEHLLLAAAQAARLQAAPLGQPREQGVDAVPCRPHRRLVPAGPRSQLQVLLHAQRPEDRASLGDVDEPRTDDPVRAGPRDVSSRKADSAGPGTHQAAEGKERRALAGAIRPDECHDFSFIDGERDAADGLDAVVADPEIADFQEGHAQSLPRYASRTCSLAVTSAGAPSAITRPKFSTTMRSHTPMIRSM